MIHAKEDCEGLERVQLDDYNDYLLDPLDEDTEVSMDRESSSNTKVDDADDIQKECRRLINAKHAQSRHRAVKTNQQGNCNLHDFSTGDLRSIINAGRDACNIIIVKQQECEEVEAYSTTHNQHPPEYLGTTRKRKLEVVEQSTRRKKTPSSKKRLEEVLYGQCLYHPKSKHSTFEYQALWKALGAPPSPRRKATGLPDQ
jgi:hypothetical protein